MLGHAAFAAQSAHAFALSGFRVGLGGGRAQRLANRCGYFGALGCRAGR
jgi:hypothetical protein